jgi:hypothetical protein
MKDILVAGYECPGDISLPAKRVLRRLAVKHVVVINYDDGGSNLAVDELESLSGEIGLTFVRLCPGVAILMDEDGVKQHQFDIAKYGCEHPVHAA